MEVSKISDADNKTTGSVTLKDILSFIYPVITFTAGAQIFGSWHISNLRIC